jgi:Flp pilus assembly protein TadD
MAGVTAPVFRLRLRALDDGPEAPAAEDDAHALKLFQRAAGRDPHDGDYHYILGAALLRAGRFPEAAGVCGEAVQLNRGEADYHYALGAALWGLEQHEEAEAAFREAVRLRPEDARALNGLGCALARLGRRREAVSFLHQALHHAEPAADIRGNLAVALWARGHTAGALRAFREAARLAPGDTDLQHNLGLALGALGRHEEALGVFRKVAADRPSDPDARLDVAETLHALGRDEEARKDIDAALAIDALALAARPRLREMLDARRLARLREELARERPASSPFSVASRLAFELGDAVGGAARDVAGAGRRLSSALLLAAVVALGYGAYRVVPPHVTRYLLQDDIAGIAGAPVREDADVLDRLMHAVEERGLGAYIRESSFEIRTRPRWRRIICRYEVPVRILPGLVHTFRFHIETEKPYIAEPDPVFL